VLSVNIAAVTRSTPSDIGVTGIDKRPVDGPVRVRAPGPKGLAGSGLVGDQICDRRRHGGDDRAVSAYAREDLDAWAAELGRPLACGVFGENLTTAGLDITHALVGERWQVGDRVVLEVALPRIPCHTFADWLDERGWVKRFTARRAPGAKLRVVTGGPVRAGDALSVVYRPDHEVTVELAFRALTTERDLLPRLLVADALPDETRQRILD
jgi:MOSC domain-containing protein YiiM